MNRKDLVKESFFQEQEATNGKTIHQQQYKGEKLHQRRIIIFHEQVITPPWID